MEIRRTGCCWLAETAASMGISLYGVFLYRSRSNISLTLSIADLLNIASIAEHCDSKNATIYANSQNLAFNPIKLAVSVVFEIKD